MDSGNISGPEQPNPPLNPGDSKSRSSAHILLGSILGGVLGSCCILLILALYFGNRRGRKSQINEKHVPSYGKKVPFAPRPIPGPPRTAPAVPPTPPFKSYVNHDIPKRYRKENNKSNAHDDASRGIDAAPGKQIELGGRPSESTAPNPFEWPLLPPQRSAHPSISLTYDEEAEYFGTDTLDVDDLYPPQRPSNT